MSNIPSSAPYNSPLAVSLVSPSQEVIPVIGSSVRLPCVAESDLTTTITSVSLPVEPKVLQNETLLITNY